MSKICNYFSRNITITTKNLGIIFIASFIVNIINFFYQIIMGRLLGPSEYGILNVIFSFLLIAAAIMGTVQTTSAKYSAIYLAEDNIDKIKSFLISITKRILIFTIIISVILVVFINSVVSFLRIESILPVIFLGIMVIEGSLIAIGRGTLQAIKNFKSLGLNLIAEVFLKLGLGIILVYVGLKANGAILGLMLATLFSYFLILLPLRKILGRKKESTIDNKIDIKRFYKNILLIFISTILFSLLSYADIVLVKHFFTSNEVGYYSAAAQIGRIVLYFTGAFILVIFPRFSEKFTKKEGLKNLVLKSFVFILLISGVFLIICFLFPEFIIRILFGDKYLLASNLIFKYGLFMSIISFINLQVFYFISVDKYYYLISLFLILSGMITLIWFYHGSLINVLIILIYSSLIVFIINFLLMALPYKNKEKFKYV
jgi:O-antigen/teichoic acid export membrane protein